MKKDKYLESLLNGSGHINKNKFKEKESQPDLIGYIKIENKIYRLSAWEKNKDGEVFYSINTKEF